MVTFAEQEQVDEFVRRASAAGADVLSEPQQQPWGYAGNFADPDGHLWMVIAKPPRSP